jgi:hypothetical protein
MYNWQKGFSNLMSNDSQEKKITKPNFKKMITVNQAAEISGLTPRHIRLLLSKGTIWGVKMGRDWFTTEGVVREYIAQDRRPGPKMDKKPN